MAEQIHQGWTISDWKHRRDWSSRFPGVAWDPRNRKWRVQITVAGKTRHFGLYADEHEAADVAATILAQRATDPAAIVARIEADKRERVARLRARARELGLRATPDYCQPDQWIVWEPTEYGVCELVTRERCTCERFRVWGRCEHHAFLLDQVLGETAVEPREAA